ncbi:hypothetical protein O6H91_07G101600 [Diphasiastrum complanatum]|uniref:Uncharacterized protein n=1 Tax=Diphasiastrum complanatum TaxID=34168 RepID=A0ACC2D8B0_DIPCM|nr:hypothetical protein O6H91_07G101600 [Diphasiastrum complanatum]
MLAFAGESHQNGSDFIAASASLCCCMPQIGDGEEISICIIITMHAFEAESLCSLLTGCFFWHTTPLCFFLQVPGISLGYTALARQDRSMEKVWESFFSDPSQWWDHRLCKLNSRHPDFKHKRTQQGLWIWRKGNPRWVKARLATVTGTIQQSVFSWNTVLLRFVKDGQYRLALDLYKQMQHESIKPDTFTMVQVLNACASLTALEEGRLVHAQTVENGYDSDLFVGNSLVNMYSKCGSIDDACRAFSKINARDVVSWTAMIVAHAKSGQGEKALSLYRQMQLENVKPDTFAFVSVLNACASMAALPEGRHLHAQILEDGCQSNVFVGSGLIDMYAKCGSIEDSCKVFNVYEFECDVVSWNAMIVGYVKCGQSLKALELYWQMQREQVKADTATFVGVLNACAELAALEDGRRVHAEILQHDCECNVMVESCLVDMYIKCGSLENAFTTFSDMRCREVVSWTVMIVGYGKFGQSEKALDLYRQMQLEQVKPDAVTFVSVLNACANTAALEEGRLVHAQIIQYGCEADIRVRNCLIDMYAKCGSIEDSCKVFNDGFTTDVISWTAMIGGYVKCGQEQKALKFYQQMLLESVEPVNLTFVGVLSACSNVAALKEGRHVHAKVMETGCVSDVAIANCLIDMYSKSGCIEDACRIFNHMPSRDHVSWNAMIMGYALHGHGKEALRLLEHMFQEDLDTDGITFVGLLSACNHAGLIDEGHFYFEHMNPVCAVSTEVEHYSCMVDLLGRAGKLDEAEALITKMPCEPNLTIWTALLGACRNSGNVEMGERIARKLLDVDPQCASAYVLLSNMYAAAGH